MKTEIYVLLYEICDFVSFENISVGNDFEMQPLLST